MTKKETEELIQMGLGRELYRFLEGLCPMCETPSEDPDVEMRFPSRDGLCKKCLELRKIEGADPMMN